MDVPVAGTTGMKTGVASSASPPSGSPYGEKRYPLPPPRLDRPTTGFPTGNGLPLHHAASATLPAG